MSDPPKLERRFRELGALGTATLAVMAVLGTLWTGIRTWDAVQNGFIEQGVEIKAIRATLETHTTKLDDLNTRLAGIERHEPNRHAEFVAPVPAPDLWGERTDPGVSYGGGGTH